MGRRSGRLGVELDVDALGSDLGFRLDLGGAEPVVSMGLLAIALGGLVLFGLTGPSGRLTRLAAGLGALSVVALFVAYGFVGQDASPDQGAVLVVLGCIVGYVGGALGRR